VGKVGGLGEAARCVVVESMARIHSRQVVDFILRNELTNNRKVVPCFVSEQGIAPRLAENLKVIDQIYPKSKIDLVLVKGKCGPQRIEKLSLKLGVPKNYMFISTPGDRFPHNIAESGDVRRII
jgi:hypothetical protein